MFSFISFLYILYSFFLFRFLKRGGGTPNCNNVVTQKKKNERSQIGIKNSVLRNVKASYIATEEIFVAKILYLFIYFFLS